MWWTRKVKNRRLKSTAVLDVKARSRRVRAARWRMLATALSVSLGLLAGLFLAWCAGNWVLNYWFLQNPAFAIRELRVETNGVIPSEQLLAWAGVKVGDNLLALNLGRIKRHLELVSLIKSVSVERLLPNTLKLRVTERKPLAQAFGLIRPSESSSYEIAGYYLDKGGCVMAPMAFGQRSPEPSGLGEGLPVIEGFDNTELRPGWQVDSPQVMAALRLIEVFDRSPMFGIARLTSIDVSAPDVLQVTTDRGSQVTMAFDNLALQLRRWRAIYDYGLRFGRSISNLDLSVTNNLPVHWLESNLATPSQGLNPKTSRYRKNHA
ncbi:MAG: FtsQ-type POTRA domain-containing protein [Candidatus Omnitrophica bacterium]|nr:FtsQ-type POTRA domain-containing protein [Candidatus Omnitrophota bacterium]